MKTYIEFKTKAVDIFNQDNSFSHKQVFLPITFKPSHIINKENHRMFSGKVKPEILNIRAKNILSKMGIVESFSLESIPDGITVSGEFMLTIRIELN